MASTKFLSNLVIDGATGTVLDVQGSVGQLFSVTDSLTGDLFAVSDISGIPILNVNSSGAVDIDGTLNLGDNDKIQLGASQDLQIYHDGTNSYINEIGDGDLIIKGGNDITFRDAVDNLLVNMNQSNSVELYYGGSKKFETTNTGVTVTGNITATNFSGSSSGTNTGDQDLSGYSTASGVEDNADVTDTTNVVAALTAGTNVQIAANGTISATDTDTVYTHPTSAGNKHIPTGGSAGQFLRYSSSGTATWATPSYTTNTNTTYTAGTGLTLTGTSFSVTANTYATAAQGTTADAALPKAGGTLTGDLTFSGTGKKIIYGNQISYNLPAQGTKQKILSLSTSTFVKVFMTSSENGYIQPIELHIFNRSDTEKPQIKKLNDWSWHTHSNDIHFSSDTSGNVYAEKVSYSTGRVFRLKYVELIQGDCTLITSADTTTNDTGTDECIEGANARVAATSSAQFSFLGAGVVTTNSSGIIGVSTGYAPKASPALTGTPTAPTAGATVNTTQLATTAFVQTAVSNLVDSSPGALNTLNELAAALGDDASFSTTVTNSIATKLPLAGGTMTGGLTISGSLSRGTYASASNYKTGADNIVLKGNSVGRSGIFFESEKDGTNINHPSDFGFIQFHAYGTGTTGEVNELIIGVSNDADDHLVFNAPNTNGMKFRIGSSTTDYTVYHSGNLSLATLGYTGATNANYITNNNQLTNGASYLTTTGKAADSELLDGLDSTRFYRTVTSSSGTAGGGWVTVAKNQSGRKHGEVIVSDAESGDHAFIRIDWMRSYADSNFSVINVGGHANRITGVRVLSQDSDATYGWKYLQVYVTTSSAYGVKINSLGAPHGFGQHTAVTPVVQDTLSGYTVTGNALTSLEHVSLAAEEGIKAGGVIYASGGNSSNWNTAYGWGDHGLSAQDKTDISNLSGVNTGDQVLPTLSSLGALSASGTAFSLSGTDVAVGESITLAGGLSYSGTTLTSANDNTTYTAGTGLTLSGTQFSVTANTYAAKTHNHSGLYIEGIDFARRLGWVPAYGNSTEDNVSYDFQEEAIKIKHPTDTSVGGAYKAIRVKSGDKVRFSVMAKASTTISSGFYLRLYQVDGDLPNGKTHVSHGASNSHPFVEEDDRADISWVENAGLTNAWTNYEHTYTAAADGYVSLVVLNWDGAGANVIYVQQPDIQFEKVNDASKLGGVAASSYITSQRAISSTPTDGATTTAISSDWAFDNVKTAVPASAVFTDTVYTHPASAGNKHVPTGGAAGQFLKYSSSGTAVWATPSYTTNTNTTYTAGTGLTLTGTSFSVTANTYATAAQGTTADAALPKAGGTMTGALAGTTATFSGQAHFKDTGNSSGGSILMGPTGSGVNKWSYLAGTHYNQDTGSGNGSGSAGVAVIGCLSTSTYNKVLIGGNPYEINPATQIEFWTHTATTHTTGGSVKMKIAGDGALTLSAYGAGILKTNASGVVSLDTNTYLTAETFSSSDVVMSLSGTDVTAGESITLAGGLSYSGTTLTSANDNTTYTAGTGLTLTGTSFSLTGSYLPLSGGTLTGALTGSTATFSIVDTLAVIIDEALIKNENNTDVDTGTETIAQVQKGTYTAVFFDFVIKNGTNVRAGTVYSCHDGTNVEFTETSTVDLGDTSDVTLAVDISGTNMRLRATTTSDNWSVKSLVRAI